MVETAEATRKWLRITVWIRGDGIDINAVKETGGHFSISYFGDSGVKADGSKIIEAIEKIEEAVDKR